MRILWRFFFLFLFIGLFFTYTPSQADAYGNIRIPVLMYHYIRDYSNPKDKTGEGLSVSSSVFDQEMGYLASNGYTPISLDTMYAIFNHQAASPAKPVVLTFDDGYIDFYANAYTILKKYGFHATSFVITGFVGQPAYLSWNNIKEMQASGLITFESHTVHHTYLSGVSFQTMLKELQDSKAILQSQTGYPVNFVAYPFGGSNYTVWSAAKKAGYVGGLGTWYAKASYSSLNMPRVRISGNIPLPLFAARIR